MCNRRSIRAVGITLGEGHRAGKDQGRKTRLLAQHRSPFSLLSPPPPAICSTDAFPASPGFPLSSEEPCPQPHGHLSPLVNANPPATRDLPTTASAGLVKPLQQLSCPGHTKRRTRITTRMHSAHSRPRGNLPASLSSSTVLLSSHGKPLFSALDSGSERKPERGPRLLPLLTTWPLGWGHRATALAGGEQPRSLILDPEHSFLLQCPAKLSAPPVRRKG